MHMVSALRSRGWTGNPPAVTLTGANGPDGTHPRPVVEAIPLVQGKQGRPRRRPNHIQDGRAYGSEPHRR
jgi:hypothetical protein